MGKWLRLKSSVAGHKICRHCLEEKPIELFGNSNGTTDGLQSWCKSCTQEAVRRVQRKGKIIRPHKPAKPITPEMLYRLILPPASFRQHARMCLYVARRSGRITRPSMCDTCGVSGRVEGHHDDHRDYYNVLWLCRQCHIIAERQKKQALIERAASLFLPTAH